MSGVGRLIVVGGHSRHVGKTTVVAAALAVLRPANWVAIKVSSHMHGSGTGLLEETDAGSGSQSARYLQAGARKAFLLRAPDERFGEAAGAVRNMVETGQDVIVESNRLVASCRPDLVLFVTSPAISDWKPSSRLCLGAADAVVILGEGKWPDKTLTFVDRTALALPYFRLDGDQQCSASLIAWLRHRLELPTRELAGRCEGNGVGNVPR